MRHWIALSLFLLVAPSAMATDICAKKDPTTYDMLDCIAIQHKVADRELNQTYQKLLKAPSSPYSKNALIKAESDWIKFRDSQCILEASSVAGGTAEPVFYGNCMIQMIKDRTVTLKQLLNWNEH